MSETIDAFEIVGIAETATAQQLENELAMEIHYGDDAGSYALIADVPDPIFDRIYTGRSALRPIRLLLGEHSPFVAKVHAGDLQYVEWLTLDEMASGELIKALATAEIDPDLDKDTQELLGELVAFARDISTSTKRYVLVIG